MSSKEVIQCDECGRIFKNNTSGILMVMITTTGKISKFDTMKYCNLLHFCDKDCLKKWIDKEKL